ncbi:hypothetical protein LNKW23_26900 [Paralimibaculum aggregatum]|uniref:YjbF family lipoprotein n=1 Tax=Paralimibaculum aggregatum TaxID=3036245 RepID=A0ABQ6LJN9_9RHOB|nr:YjbF family lipoprotein [Limibaculum sp. NKW23]GMG83477.1 hypothetical protein LNKW23_26900 [Limibaculum sp. NKW23]
MTGARAALAALLLGGLLAGCSSQGPTDLGKVGLLAWDAVAPAPEAPAPLPDRAALEATGAAVIRLAGSAGPPGYVAALADNGGYVTYQDAAGRAVVLHGAAIARTHGFGHDLTGLRTAREDPVSHPRPLIAWPGQVVREYQYRVKDGAAYSVVLTCLFERGPRQHIEILGRRHQVVEVAERCANHRRRVENRHWVEAETGRIWRSAQWIGPFEDPLTLEIVTPYRPARRW